MPRFNGTGPTGEGPMSGRGLGTCVTDSPHTVGRFLRRGFASGAAWCGGARVRAGWDRRGAGAARGGRGWARRSVRGGWR